MNRIGWLENLGQDLRYGARLLRMSPGFTAVAVASLALGIGANTAIFELLNAVRLRSLPVPAPHELVEIKIVGGNGGMGLNPQRYGGLTRPIWDEIRRTQQAFSGVFAWGADEVRVGTGIQLRRARSIQVSGDLFPVLRIPPWRGRLFQPEDEAGTCPALRAVVSFSFWQSYMAGRELDRDNRLTVNGELYQVIGVTPPGFLGLAVGEGFDLALPYCQPRNPHRRDVFDTVVMGRLRPGWSLERATAHLNAISNGIFEATEVTGYSDSSVKRYRNSRLAAYPASSGVSWLRETYDSSLWLLLGITGLVLLIACANLANLMLARASVREREIAVRLALGASRGRLFRQLLVEGGLLAASGATLGAVAAHWFSSVLVSIFATGDSSVDLPVAVDWRVLLFLAAVAGATCIVFGVIPSFRAARIQPEAAMRAGGRSLTAGRSRFTMHRVMVVTQIAVSLVLMFAAILFVRSFRNLTTFDAGMRQEGITVVFIGFQGSNISADRNEVFRQELLTDVRRVPGVLGAATTTMVPLLGGAWSHGVQAGNSRGDSRFTAVSPGYFATMGIPVLTGRDFGYGDTKTSQRVAVVNQTFVRRYLQGVNPIGQTLRTSPEPDYPSTVYEIVGVIPDTRYNGLRGETPPMAFVASAQYPDPGQWTAIMVHSSMTSAATISSLKTALAQNRPELVLEFADFRARIQDGLVRERLMAVLSGFFGLLAVLLSMVGLYGVISYLVARRRNEIGIRVALGAQRSHVIAMVMRESGRMLAGGIAIGVGLSLLAGRSAGALLFGLKPNDVATLVAAGVLLAAVAALASLIPANRASKLDPIQALRHE